MKSHKIVDLRCAVSKITTNSDKLCEDHPLFTSFGKLPFVSVCVTSDFDAEFSWNLNLGSQEKRFENPCITLTVYF